MCLSPYFSTPIGLHFLRFLKHIFEYTALHYTVDRLNLYLSICMVCLCKYHNSVTRQFKFTAGVLGYATHCMEILKT
jgi:hypothetical protein